MANQDATTRFDVTRNDEPKSPNNKTATEPKPDAAQKTEVKNSNAAGIGAIGRSNEQIEKNEEGRPY